MEKLTRTDFKTHKDDLIGKTRQDAELIIGLEACKTDQEEAMFILKPVFWAF